MPQMPAARLSDMHVCPVTDGPKPHVGGPVLPACSVNVLTGGLPQARVSDRATCVSVPDILVKGSPTVLVNKLPAVRIIVDTTAHGGRVVVGCFTVWIGEGGGGSGAKSGTAPAAKQGNAPQSSSVPASEHAAIKQALADAKKMLEDAKRDLENWEPATQARARKWFGDASDATQQKMLERVERAIKQVDTMDVGNFYRAEDDPKFQPGDEDRYAYVYPRDKTRVYLGNDFEPAPATGPDSKAGTIVHEVSHYRSVGRTRDHAYGPVDCQNLARSDPGRAQVNADSFEYFVEGL